MSAQFEERITRPSPRDGNSSTSRSFLAAFAVVGLFALVFVFGFASKANAAGAPTVSYGGATYSNGSVTANFSGENFPPGDGAGATIAVDYPTCGDNCIVYGNPGQDETFSVSITFDANTCKGKADWASSSTDGSTAYQSGTVKWDGCKASSSPAPPSSNPVTPPVPPTKTTTPKPPTSSSPAPHPSTTAPSKTKSTNPPSSTVYVPPSTVQTAPPSAPAHTGESSLPIIAIVAGLVGLLGLMMLYRNKLKTLFARGH